MVTNYATGGDPVSGEGGNDVATWGTFSAVMAASIIIGVLIGKKMDRYIALKIIKEARKPEIVERF